MGGSLNRRNALLIGVLLASYPALVGAALWPLPQAFALVALVSYAAELAASQNAVERLARLHLGVTLRFLTREMAVVLLVARTIGTESRWFALLAGGLFLFHGVRAVQTWLAGRLNRCHNLSPIATRNLDLSVLRIPPAPPETLVNWRGARLLFLDALPVGLTVLTVLGNPAGRERLGVYGLAAALALQLAATAALAVHLRRAAHLMDRRRLVEEVEGQVRAYRPEVLLYFSGPPDAAYQATMWLGVLERIQRRALVVLRERDLLAVLGETSLPVLCVPLAVDLMNLRGLETARVALFASNVGNNIHLLRMPGVRSVFIGHGDSDKEASFNPFTKVYDEVWVAGPAGRDRYRRTQVGVRDEAIVEVGRPQLAGVRPQGPGLPYPTVLYAPTWEGWTDDLFHTSIGPMGVALVRALIEQPIRLIYKPHPLTGHRSRAVRDAHQEIMEMLHQAALAGTAAARRLALAETVIRNQVVTGATPHLYECFNQADLLISDISSVVTDFIASGKPYVVTNVEGLPAAEFRERYPTAEAAYLLGRDLAELPEIMYQLGQDEDVLAPARREVRAYVLGPGHPDAPTRFDDAVNAAYARAAPNSHLQTAPTAVDTPA